MNILIFISRESWHLFALVWGLGHHPLQPSATEAFISHRPNGTAAVVLALFGPVWVWAIIRSSPRLWNPLSRKAQTPPPQSSWRVFAPVWVWAIVRSSRWLRTPLFQRHSKIKTKLYICSCIRVSCIVCIICIRGYG